MVQRTVLKVDISCQKCKQKLLKAVSTLHGIDKIETDEAKGTLTVTGNADPYEIVLRTRKATGKCAEVVTIGPPPAPPKQDGQKKPEEKKPEAKKQDNKDEKKPFFHDPHTCPECQRIVIVPVGPYNQPTASCSVM
ncbi:hypothetical protein Tsubulata_000321 [Turnera subulata]|uniref:HMA domain-containing protein n=1 Tax=Turnera subulata TaxID=218843 RepID=A0A9Q0IY47_9ROSI|nr:hypothetical protein Tsubulata_000321 [Turnera subulata]